MRRRARSQVAEGDAQLARGWSKDHFGLPPADVYLACDPDIVVARLDAILAPRDADPPGGIRAVDDAGTSQTIAPASATHETRASSRIASRVEVAAHRANALTLATLADVVNTATRDVDICVTRCRLAGMGRTGISGIRSITSASKAAAASVRVRASRSVQRWR